MVQRIYVKCTDAPMTTCYPNVGELLYLPYPEQLVILSKIGEYDQESTIRADANIVNGVLYDPREPSVIVNLTKLIDYQNMIDRKYSSAGKESIELMTSWKLNVFDNTLFWERSRKKYEGSIGQPVIRYIPATKFLYMQVVHSSPYIKTITAFRCGSIQQAEMIAGTTIGMTLQYPKV